MAMVGERGPLVRVFMIHTSRHEQRMASFMITLPMDRSFTKKLVRIF